jgi:hypothetical protein
MRNEKFDPFPVSLDVKDWHSPFNESCDHNINPTLACTCKRVRIRKNYRVVKVHDTDVPHNCKPDIIMEVYPNGRLIFREAGRRKTSGYATTAGAIYSRLLMNEAKAKVLAKAQLKRQRKLERKKARKKLR